MITKRKLALLYPQWTKKDIESSDKCGTPSYGESIYPQIDMIQNILPVSQSTGHSDSFITRFFTSLSADERAMISQFVKSIPPMSNYKMTDEDLFNLTPSRYLQDATELEAYKDAMASIVKMEYDNLNVNNTSSEPSQVSDESGDVVSS